MKIVECWNSVDLIDLYLHLKYIRCGKSVKKSLLGSSNEVFGLSSILFMKSYMLKQHIYKYNVRI